MAPPKIIVEPSLATVQKVLRTSLNSPCPPNLVPLCSTVDAEFQTPSSVYLRLTSQAKTKSSFLFESAATTETIGRWSFIGADPRETFKTGPGHGEAIDPMPLLQERLAERRVATVPGQRLPPLTGGAIGYVGYDCVKYFEPRTERPLRDMLEVPESLFMLFDTVIAFDHFYQSIQLVTYLNIPPFRPDQASFSSPLDVDPEELDKAYRKAVMTLRKLSIIIGAQTPLPLPPQGPITPNQQFTSNIGQSGYEKHVHSLKAAIAVGEIIQAVPSHRIARPTSLHPFNIYRHLRTVNPSPYLFYVDCGDFQLVGASPEVLVKSEGGRIITHPIAGTVKRGRTLDEDEELAAQLRASLKDRAEHVMLVDLARNDVNRVCDPLTTRVDKLMEVQRFSHVQHLTSVVSGVLRPGKTRYDAFRSIFPAGTVSGAPKVRAMELIGTLEGEKRAVYGGAVGYFGYSSVDSDGNETEGAMDTCIALRTMVVKDGVAYLQAGGGIVYDSDATEEWEETMNKLGANINCIDSAEAKHAAVVGWGPPEGESAEKEASLTNGDAVKADELGEKTRVALREAVESRDDGRTVGTPAVNGGEAEAAHVDLAAG